MRPYRDKATSCSHCLSFFRYILQLLAAHFWSISATYNSREQRQIILSNGWSRVFPQSRQVKLPPMTCLTTLEIFYFSCIIYDVSTSCFGVKISSSFIGTSKHGSNSSINLSWPICPWCLLEKNWQIRFVRFV